MKISEVSVTPEFNYHELPVYAVLQIDWQLDDGWQDYATIRDKNDKRLAYNHVLNTSNFRIRNQEYAKITLFVFSPSHSAK